MIFMKLIIMFLDLANVQTIVPILKGRHLNNVSLMECKHLYVISDAPNQSFGSSCSHKIRRTKGSRTKITRSRRKRNERNVQFIEREKTRCLWNVPPDASRPPLKKMTSCSRRSLEKAKGGERANEGKKRGGDHLSFVSYRNAEGNGRSGTKVFLFPEDPFSPLLFPDYPPISFDVNLGL